MGTRWNCIDDAVLTNATIWVRSEFLPLVKWYHWLTNIVQAFTNGTNGIIGTNGTNVTKIRQQMMQTEYSVGNSTNAGKVT